MRRKNIWQNLARNQMDGWLATNGQEGWKESQKHLPQPLRIHIKSFGTLGQLMKFKKKNVKKPKNAPPQGGSPNFFGG